MSIFGKSKDGGATRKTYWKLKDGEQTFRILPALGDNAEDGIWIKHYSVHFGYKNSKGQMRPFQSSEVKNYKTKMIEVPDAALDRINTLKAQQLKAKEAGQKEVADRIGKALEIYNLDKNYYVNAMDEQGNIGVLKLRHKAKLALDDLIKNLAKSGVDPRDPVNGRFLVFGRSGNALDTTFTVRVKQEELNAPGIGLVKRDLVSSLTPEMADRMGTRGADGKFKYKEASDLLNLYRKLSAAEVERIVREGATAVDEIFDTKVVAAPVATSEYEDEYGINSLPKETVPVETAATAASVTSGILRPVATTIGTPPPVAVAFETKLPTLTPPSMAAGQKTTAELLAEQSDEDFFKSLGVEV